MPHTPHLTPLSLLHVGHRQGQGQRQAVATVGSATPSAKRAQCVLFLQSVTKWLEMPMFNQDPMTVL